MAIVVTVTRDGKPRDYVFKHSPVRFGRNRLNDLCLADPQVSQWHGLIKFNSSTISFADLGSTNGTRVEGRGTIQDGSVVVGPEDELRIAKIEIRIRRATTNEIVDSDDELTETSGPPTLADERPTSHFPKQGND